MKDYSQILSGSGSQGGGRNFSGGGGGNNRNRNNRNRNRSGQGNGNWTENSGSQVDQVNDDPVNTDVTASGGNINKRTKFALANSLGTTAEALRGVGISRRAAHKIVDTAYQGGTRS
jgi:hypothetical protein